MTGIMVALMAMLAADPATAPQPTLASGLEAALATCDSWLLHPATWAEDISAFPEKAGLKDRIRAQGIIADVALPPPALRANMHHFHVPAGQNGFYVTVSDTQPYCHIAGGGPDDFQPQVEAVLSSTTFSAGWTWKQDKVADGMRSGEFVSKADAALTMILSRGEKAGMRNDNVQLLATAQYQIGN